MEQTPILGEIAELKKALVNQGLSINQLYRLKSVSTERYREVELLQGR